MSSVLIRMVRGLRIWLKKFRNLFERIAVNIEGKMPYSITALHSTEPSIDLESTGRQAAVHRGGSWHEHLAAAPEAPFLQDLAASVRARRALFLSPTFDKLARLALGALALSMRFIVAGLVAWSAVGLAPHPSGVATRVERNGLVRVELNRCGKLNALSESMWQGLRAAASGEGPLLVTSGDAKAFSAGGGRSGCARTAHRQTARPQTRQQPQGLQRQSQHRSAIGARRGKS